MPGLIDYTPALKGIQKGWPAQRLDYVFGLLQEPQSIMLGLGKGDRWLIDAVPPDVDPLRPLLPTICLKPSLVRGLYPLTPDPELAPEPDITVNGDGFLYTPPGITREEVEELAIRKVLISLNMPRISLPLNSLRYVCVLHPYVVKEGVSEEPFVALGDLESYQITYMEHFRPLPLNRTLNQTLSLILEV